MDSDYESLGMAPEEEAYLLVVIPMFLLMMVVVIKIGTMDFVNRIENVNVWV
jgi:hypothetical protein